MFLYLSWALFFLLFPLIKNASVLFVQVNVWNCTVKSLETTSMWVQHAEWSSVWTWTSIIPHNITCICIVTVWCCVWEWCASHLLCPLSRQPVQFCESEACFWDFWFKCLQKREMWVRLCTSRMYYFKIERVSVCVCERYWCKREKSI